MSTEQNAILSVADKTGIEQFAGNLHELGWKLWASGGTGRTIAEAGIPVTDVAELVGGEAILGHRVVTLSREVHAGLLADMKKPADLEELKRQGIPLLGLACVDMYPLEEEIAKEGSTPATILEQTDIGGPTILRAAAKGRRIVLSVAEQREQVIDWLNAGKPDEEEFLRELAARAEYEVARYVGLSAKAQGGDKVSIHAARLVSHTKYGENPQQTPAGLYADNRVNVDPLNIEKFVHVKGWELSFVNETDIFRLRNTMTKIAAGFATNFGEVPPTAIAMKHNSACGAAVAKTYLEAVQNMVMCDTRAIHGAVVMINGEVDKEIAEALVRHGMKDGETRLLDGVVASGFTPEALETLSRKKLRAVYNPALANLDADSWDKTRQVSHLGGNTWLEQPSNPFILDFNDEGIINKAKKAPTEQQKRDLVLAWAIGTTTNSNTITSVNNGALVGNGVGQQDRVGAALLALTRSTVELPRIVRRGLSLYLTFKLDWKKLAGASHYSDSFYPFADAPLMLIKAGAGAMFTSRGSVNDDIVFAAINKKTRGEVPLMTVDDKKGRGFHGHP